MPIKKFFGDRKPLLRFLLLFSLINACFFWLIGLRYLYIVLSSKSLFSTSMHTYASLSGKALVLFFTFTTYLGHFALLALLPCFFILMPLLLMTNKKLIIMPIAVLLATACNIVLLADSLVFVIYHFHINSTILQIALSEKFGLINFLELSKNEIILIFTIFLILLLAESGIAIFIWKKIIVPGKQCSEIIITTFLLGCLGISYLIWATSVSYLNNVFAQQTPNWPLYNTFFAAGFSSKNSADRIDIFSEIGFSQPLFASSSLHYPLHAIENRPSSSAYNILIIGIDAWRFDAMNATISPNLAEFAKKSWYFTSHFSGGNSTQAGLFSLFYSLPSNYWTAMLQQHKGAILIDELLKKNYQTRVLFSCDNSFPPFNKTIFYSIKDLQPGPAPGETSTESDHHITQKFKDFVLTRNKSQPFFAFLFYGTAHNYCQTPHKPKIFPTNENSCMRIYVDRTKKSEIINHYKNAVHFVDNEIKQVLEMIETQNLLKNTIVIITGDHGEEFDDSGQDYWGHGSNYTRYQVQTPLIVNWPGQKPAVLTHRTTHYDIAPTLMTKALNCPNPVSDYSIGLGLFNQSPRPYILVGSYINMGIIENKKNTTLYTSGSVRVADEHASFLENTKPNQTVIAQALLKMREYFKH